MADDTAGSYQVLARKYRPGTFGELIGQDAMVRILRNSFAADRVAHAFILTGVRGVGKTTTARIIAKALNCTGSVGTAAVEPCGACDSCTSIAEGRHVDVLEMDAASRTGVNDIREIIESVSYRPANGRYKIYIIDEVHMLSTSAFNALLKTLEEPPEHVKFIFATTEIRMVPVTVLSRCQRFDLRRIEPQAMQDHLLSIARLENIKIADDAAALVTRASEGSARDAVSLLDQAIAHSGEEIETENVREMLGLADRGRTLDLLDLIMKGDAAGALEELAGQYSDGADPAAVLRDLAETAHWISILKVSPETAHDISVSPDEFTRGRAIAELLPMRVLSRAWQMLLKAIEETPLAPNSIMAAEMAVIRLCHVAELPTAEELLRRLSAQETTEPAAAVSAPAPGQKEQVSRTPSRPPPAPGVSLKDNRSGAGKSAADTRPTADAKPQGADQINPRPQMPQQADSTPATEQETEPEGAHIQSADADGPLPHAVKEHRLVRGALGAFPGATVSVSPAPANDAAAESESGGAVK